MFLEELLPHPIEAVWAVLTDAAAISDWLMATTDFEPAVGARFRMKAERLGADGWVRAQVTDLDPPRRMVWAWSGSEDGPVTTVMFELAPVADGTRLRLTHVGEIDEFVGGLLRDGWPSRLELLRRSLDD